MERQRPHEWASSAELCADKQLRGHDLGMRTAAAAAHAKLLMEGARMLLLGLTLTATRPRFRALPP